MIKKSIDIYYRKMNFKKKKRKIKFSFYDKR